MSKKCLFELILLKLRCCCRLQICRESRSSCIVKKSCRNEIDIYLRYDKMDQSKLSLHFGKQSDHGSILSGTIKDVWERKARFVNNLHLLLQNSETRANHELPNFCQNAS